ncbi:TatD family hydrolase [Candidatus Daviesbacteria bacterium]|nr:TatD family hydrolase [Candidatus Daviesbacteria bacterium]
MLIDTHAHLYWDSFKDDFNDVIQRALDADITTIINTGVDVEKSQIALDQTNNTNLPEGLSVYSTIGIHPHEAPKYSDKEQETSDKLEGDIKELQTVYSTNPKKVVAVGECGLDYLFNPEFIPSALSLDQVKALEVKLFQAQIDLAKRLKLPLVVHSRDDRSQNHENTECWDKVIEMTKDHFGIYHCYSGLPQTTDSVLQNTNFLISFAANITYPKNEYLRKAAKIIPLDRIILETDSPFLSSQSRRGQRNEPATVKEIAQLIAELKGSSLKEVAKQTTTNAKRVFKI